VESTLGNPDVSATSQTESKMNKLEVLHEQTEISTTEIIKLIKTGCAQDWNFGYCCSISTSNGLSSVIDLHLLQNVDKTTAPMSSKRLKHNKRNLSRCASIYLPTTPCQVTALDNNRNY
jgi:hypothetical protein